MQLVSAVHFKSSNQRLAQLLVNKPADPCDHQALADELGSARESSARLAQKATPNMVGKTGARADRDHR